LNCHEFPIIKCLGPAHGDTVTGLQLAAHRNAVPIGLPDAGENPSIAVITSLFFTAN